MNSYLRQAKGRIDKTENARQKQRKTIKSIARLREQEINALLEKQKHKGKKIYYEDDPIDIDMPDETGEDSEDSLFVSSEPPNYEENTDSDSDSGGVALTDSTAIESETEVVGESIAPRQALGNDDEIIYPSLDGIDDEVPENPFCLVPAGGKCITKPQDSWSYGDAACYVFPISFKSPFSYLSVQLRPSHRLAKGWAAYMTGHAVKGIVMGDPYYMGHLGLGRSSSFFKISPKSPGTTCITVFVIITSESSVRGQVRDYEQGRKKTGPFLQLN